MKTNARPSTAYFQEFPIDISNPQPTTREFPSRKLDLQRILGHIVRFLSGSSEPQIQFKRDRLGNHFWRVYDPTTNQSTSFSSETEVRIWLEQRYSR
ncbi:MAG TPA: hypothetical protein V6D10_26225 [Trichocoleus sp.]